MSAYPLSVQLYSVRDAAKSDPQGTLAAIAAMGYLGVECAGFWGWSPKEFRRRVEDLGMRITASHSPWTTSASVSQSIDIAKELGLDVVAGGFGRDNFKDLDAIAKTCDEVNAICDKLEPHGIRLYLHNHAWEFDRFDAGDGQGPRWGHAILAERCPRVWFEIDTYWAANFGTEDPAAAVRHFAHRALFLHIKDGSLVKDQPHVAVGSGKINVPAVVAAANGRVTRALIVELDACGTDMLTAVRQSRDYLVAKGLAIARPALG